MNNFEKALDNCCECCCDDGMASLTKIDMHSYLDARGADKRRPLVGAIDHTVEKTDDGGVHVVQVTYPLQHDPTMTRTFLR